MHKEPWICLCLKSDSPDLPAETRLTLSYLEYRYILFFHFSLQAVSVGKHVKGYHYIIANLVRCFVICCFVFWGICLLCRNNRYLQLYKVGRSFKKKRLSMWIPTKLHISPPPKKMYWTIRITKCGCSLNFRLYFVKGWYLWSGWISSWDFSNPSSTNLHPSFLLYLPNGSLSMSTLLLSVALFEVTLLALEATQHLKKKKGVGGRQTGGLEGGWCQ